jgi:hypothetical protein
MELFLQNASSKLEAWAIALIVIFIIVVIVAIILVVLYMKYGRRGQCKNRALHWMNTLCYPPDKRKMSMTSSPPSSSSGSRIAPNSKENEINRSMKTHPHISYLDHDIFDKDKDASSSSASSSSASSSGGSRPASGARVIVPKAAPSATALPNHLQWQRSHAGLYRSNAIDPLPPYTENQQ